MDSTFLPNLPGFKPHDVHKSGKKPHFLKFSDGIRFLADPENETSADLNLTASITSLGSTSPGKHSKSAYSSHPILKFDAEFGNRKASILFYTEDNTVKIIEIPELNSGITQGVILKRSVIPRIDGSTATLEDFQVGQEITIYGRAYYITDCNNNTRAYLNDVLGRNIPPSAKYDNLEKTKSQFKEEPWGKYHSKKNNLKEFNEAKLGNTVNTKGREGFMLYGTEKLKFLASWDDTESLYGDRTEFALVYHLADDTIEIFTVQTSGTKQFPKMLRRSPLPKSAMSSSLLTDDHNKKPDNFHWTDFYIGMEVNVYGRNLLIVDADVKTREFYAKNDYALGDGIMLPKIEHEFVFTREIPPHTGFGSEEDSLKSVIGSLLPTAGVQRSNITETRQFMYFAKLVSTDEGSLDRKFVITVYKQDNTLKIQEPPIRNSGYVGGVFLSRRKVKRFGGGEGYMSEYDFTLGGQVKILTHTFDIVGANDYTTKFMEENGLIANN